MSGIGTFSAQVARFGKDAVTKIERVRRGVTIKLLSAVINDTPVLTGRLRGNWRISEGQPVLVPVDRVDPTGGTVLTEMNETIAKSNGDVTIFFSNNLPYAQRIEYDGWSHTKAPEGMVRRNVARFNTLITMEARKR